MSSQSKSKKITSIDPKYMPPRPVGPDGKEIPWDDSPQTRQYLLQYEANAKENERRAKEYAKKREEDRKAMEEYEEKQREYRKLQLERIANLPEEQFQLFASGQRFQCSYCHIPLNFEAFCPNRRCEAQTAISTEPLMMRISEELVATTRLDQPTRDRLEKFMKPDDEGKITYQDLINRVLDIANQTKVSEATTEVKPN
jgi:hypothetical protein